MLKFAQDFDASTPTGLEKLRGYINPGLDKCVRYGHNMSMPDTSTPQPLTPAVFHILLALSNGDRHGYGIMKQVEADSQGKVKMGTGTLYGSIKRMLDAGLIRESDKRVDPDLDDERRIYYQMTDLGEKALASELERYQRIVTIAQERKLYPTSLCLLIFKRLVGSTGNS